MQLVVAEKPSVARDLARVLGVRVSGRGAFEGSGHVVTWCVGHLVELDEPASYDSRWKAWRLDVLPMIPDAFKLRPVDSARDQLDVVRALLRERRFTEVVNACDAGREGELIFRYVYDLAGSRLPVRRLWISSMTDEAIKAGFEGLRPGASYDCLGDAARCRSEADWLVGMNATRAVTVRHRTATASPLYSIGRVQTPTLAILVERERAIQSFRPRDYWEAKGTFTTAAGVAFSALWGHGPVTRLGAEPLARELKERLEAHATAADPSGPVVETVQPKRLREPPPLLFDLTSLQRTANRRFGLSAARTLEVAQALYERHKLLTYPRTDARHLPTDMQAELPKLFRGLSALEAYAGFVAPLLETPPRPGRRVFDDGRVQDHHAIVPTGKVVSMGALDRDEARIFDLVARRFIGAFYPDAEIAVTKVVVRVGARGPEAPRPESKEADKEDETILPALPPPPDRFVARGRVRLAAGWQAVAGLGTDGDERGSFELPVLVDGERLAGVFETPAKQTKPPPRHSEATLLAAMETAGRTIEDDELRAAMKDTGLGTPATRAATIETLVKRTFIARDGKALHPTATGMALIDALPVQSLASPELTGAWEARLARVARGQEARGAFMADIVVYVRQVVEALKTAPVNAVMASALAPAPRVPEGAAARPPRGGEAASRGAAARLPRDAQPASRGAAARLPRDAQPASRGGAARLPRDAQPASRGAAARLPRDAQPASRGARGRSQPGATAGATSGRARPKSPKASNAVPAAAGPLSCPRCRQGTLVAGKRGWGCSRWRESCDFVIWFEVAGTRVSDAQLRELVAKGKTRKTKFSPPGRAVVSGRLVLDLSAPRDVGAARLVEG